MASISRKPNWRGSGSGIKLVTSQTWENQMKFALLGGAALVATALMGSSQAQPVINDPGKCAQYYPDANCQNLGTGNPYTDSNFNRGYQNNYAAMRNQPEPHRRHRRHRRHDRRD
jgi:hypothetical protein